MLGLALQARWMIRGSRNLPYNPIV